MAGYRSSLSRSLISIARVSSLRSSPPLSRLRPSPATASRLHRRRLFSVPRRNLGELGCIQSFLPFDGAASIPRLTSHPSLQSRACCELFYGMNGKDG